MKLFTKIVLLISVVALLSFSAYAGSNATQSLTVTATVTNTCTLVTSGTLAFGTYDPLAVTDNTNNGTFTIRCTNGLPTHILLGQGANPDTGSSDITPLRRMKSGSSNYLSYSLYSDAGNTLAWDNSTGVSQTANGAVQTITVYGLIPKTQNVYGGSYSDTVVITVNW